MVRSRKGIDSADIFSTHPRAALTLCHLSNKSTQGQDQFFSLFFSMLSFWDYIFKHFAHIFMSTQFSLIPHTYSFVRSVISLMNPDVRLLVGCCCCHYFRERQGSYPFEVTLTIDFLFDNFSIFLSFFLCCNFEIIYSSILLISLWAHNFP